MINKRAPSLFKLRRASQMSTPPPHALVPMCGRRNQSLSEPSWTPDHHVEPIHHLPCVCCDAPLTTCCAEHGCEGTKKYSLALRPPAPHVASSPPHPYREISRTCPHGPGRCSPGASLLPACP